MNTKPVDMEKLVRDFPYGNIEDVHVIGEYQIVEYLPVNYGENDIAKAFHPHLNGETFSSISYYTLDEALVAAIACKYEGPGGRAADNFLKKMIRSKGR